MRLINMYYNSAISCLPCVPMSVVTPVGAEYQGLKFSQKVKFHINMDYFTKLTPL